LFYFTKYICTCSSGLRFMVFSATFDSISAISWRSVLLVVESRILGDFWCYISLSNLHFVFTWCLFFLQDMFDIQKHAEGGIHRTNRYQNWSPRLMTCAWHSYLDLIKSNLCFGSVKDIWSTLHINSRDWWSWKSFKFVLQ
jgi:hypothetical protein